MKKVISEEYNEDWVYMQLHMFKKGLIGPDEIKDPFIRKVRKNGVVSIIFDNEGKYFDLFNFDQNDRGLLDELFSFYRHMDLIDSYRCREDWRDGHVIDVFNDENMKLLMQISSITYPIDFKNIEQKENLCLYLAKQFQRDIESIISDYCDTIEQFCREQSKQDVKHELCDIFMDDGVYTNTCFYSYFTTVDNLISLYDKVGKKSMSIKELFTSLGREKYHADDIGEIVYNNTYGNVDFTEFQRDVKKSLENILWVLEDEDNFLDLEEYQKIIKKLSSQFQFQKNYLVPKDKNITFRILYVDPKTNKVVFNFSKPNEFDKTNKLDIDTFYNFLYYPELF